MPTAHSSITGADNHEPKGVEGASANTVYVANGSASGVWKKIPAAVLDTASVINLNKGTLIVSLDDVSNPSSIWVPITNACTITKITSVLQGSITVGDSTVTVYNNAGLSMGSVVVSFTGSAPGDIDVLNPASNNTFAANQVLKITTDGNSTTTAGLIIAIDYTWS